MAPNALQLPVFTPGSSPLLHCTKFGLGAQYNTAKVMVCVVSRVMSPQVHPYPNPQILNLRVC